MKIMKMMETISGRYLFMNYETKMKIYFSLNCK